LVIGKIKPIVAFRSLVPSRSPKRTMYYKQAATIVRFMVMTVVCNHYNWGS